MERVITMEYVLTDRFSSVNILWHREVPYLNSSPVSSSLIEDRLKIVYCTIIIVREEVNLFRNQQHAR